ncbi:MAG: hypothetical protein GX855_06105 [Firmicutes bacterium]|nr:hypothetical protein [Bacillota bacterium]
MSEKWPVQLIQLSRAFTVGVAYYSVINIPSLTSSFVAIFVALLLFDLMISLERIRGGWDVAKNVVRIVVPHVAGTAMTLVYGLMVGCIFAVLVHLGLPVSLGAILTAGLSYSLTERVPGRTSSTVGIVGGLAVFDKTYKLATSIEFFPEVGPVIVATIYGTFSALVMGWAIGLLFGGLTRLVLPRGYRTVRSSAYKLPLMLRPIQEVLDLEDNDGVLVNVQVAENSAVVGSPIGALDLDHRYGARILRIDRKESKITLPTGDEVLQAEDVLLVYLAKSRRIELENLFTAASPTMVYEFPKVEIVPQGEPEAPVEPEVRADLEAQPETEAQVEMESRETQGEQRG